MQLAMKNAACPEAANNIEALAAILARAVPASAASPASREVYMDLTHNCHYDGKPVGIIRVGYEYAVQLLSCNRAQALAWHEGARSFVRLPEETVLNNSFKEWLHNPDIAHESARPEKNSLILAPGLFWWSNDFYLKDICGFAIERDLVLIPFIYDVIWAIFPNFLGKGMTRLLLARMARLLETSGLVIADSRCAAADLATVCERNSISVPDIEICRLADDFAAAAGNKARDYLRDEPGFILYVAAMMPHKNHEFLLAVWRDLIEEHGREKIPTLVCVGAESVNSSRFIAAAFHDPVLRGRVKWLRHADDAELRWLYENCLFTVFPSLYEGWGLPVGESLAAGKVCVASNAASIPEIAPEYTDLLHPRDFPGWRARIANYIFNPEARKTREAEIAGYRPTGWSDSARAMLDGVLRRNPEPAQAPILEPGQKVENLASLNSSRYLGSGWRLHDDGSVSPDPEGSCLVFRIAAAKSHSVLDLLCRGGGEAAVEIRINDDQALSRRARAEWSEINIPLPCGHGDGPNWLEVKLKIRLITGGDTSLFLRSFRLEAAPASCAASKKELDFLERLCPELTPAFSAIAARRPDLDSMLAAENGGLALLFWAWRFGIGEEPELGRRWRVLRNVLVKLNSIIPPCACEQGYTNLVDAVWRTRPDLRQWDSQTREGQTAILAWFRNNGIAEYNLYEILEPAS